MSTLATAETFRVSRKYLGYPHFGDDDQYLIHATRVRIEPPIRVPTAELNQHHRVMPWPRLIHWGIMDTSTEQSWFDRLDPEARQEHAWKMEAVCEAALAPYSERFTIDPNLHMANYYAELMKQFARIGRQVLAQDPMFFVVPPGVVAEQLMNGQSNQNL